jgi:hypothetical protein
VELLPQLRASNVILGLEVRRILSADRVHWHNWDAQPGRSLGRHSEEGLSKLDSGEWQGSASKGKAQPQRQLSIGDNREAVNCVACRCQAEHERFVIASVERPHQSKPDSDLANAGHTGKELRPRSVGLASSYEGTRRDRWGKESSYAEPDPGEGQAPCEISVEHPNSIAD